MTCLREIHYPQAVLRSVFECVGLPCVLGQTAVVEDQIRANSPNDTYVHVQGAGRGASSLHRPIQTRENKP